MTVPFDLEWLSSGFVFKFVILCYSICYFMRSQIMFYQSVLGLTSPLLFHTFCMLKLIPLLLSVGYWNQFVSVPKVIPLSCFLCTTNFTNLYHWFRIRTFIEIYRRRFFFLTVNPIQSKHK